METELKKPKIEYRVENKQELEHLVSAMDALFGAFALKVEGTLVVKPRGINITTIEVTPSREYSSRINEIILLEESTSKKAQIRASNPDNVAIKIENTFYQIYYMPPKK